MQYAPPSSEADLRILEALASLNKISAAINQIRPEGNLNVDPTLRQIAHSATRVVPGAAAVIYTFDPVKSVFDPDSRVSAEERAGAIPADAPRDSGIGVRAISQKRRVISYEEPDLDINPEIVKAGARIVACFPLIVNEQPLGALYIYLFEERRFTQLEELMVENFVNLAAMAVYQVWRLNSMQRDLARKEEELHHLRRTGMLISSRLRLEGTLESILQMALEVTNARYGIFRQLDKDGRYLEMRAIAGAELSRPQVDRLLVDEHSVMGWVATHHQPVLVYDLMSPPWSEIYYPLDAEMEMRSELAVPLINASGRVEGVLNLESPQAGAFSEQDSHMLQSLATQAVIAIQEARLLDALQEVAQILINHPTSEVLNRLAELASDLLNASEATIWLAEDDWLVLKAASGSFQHEQRIPIENSLTGQAILNRTTILTNDVRTDERFNRPDDARQQDWTRALIIPLMVSETHDPVGAFSVYSTSSVPGRFAESEWDKKVLTCLAHYAVLAVQNDANRRALSNAQEQRSTAETFAAVGDIAANLIHQLNNKVGTIPVRIQGIQDKNSLLLKENPYLATNLAEIERSANEAMAAMRKNLVHLRPIQMAEVDVASCVHNAIESADLSEGVHVTTDDLTDLPAVKAGQNSLILVFINLIENAADAMKGEGQVHISAKARKKMVEIKVSDSGPGIPPALHDRIFELNFSGRSQSRPGKMGFGLWWVKTLMTRLGGSVTVESDGVHGTTFRLKLPAVEEHP
ncbi:MAG: GAF domain-containing protein [Chloroflexi bacterium]|nr:GAF domain-containing protein [Chloroflexota bacterium]